MAGARASSSAGRSAVMRVSSCQVAGFHCPLPLMRPAAAWAVPNSASKARSSSWLASSGLACNSSLISRNGRRPSFQRPAARLFRVSDTAAGWSRAWVLADACRSSAVRGASLCSADRSSSRALACSAPSGQLAKGCSVALASSVCAGRGGAGWARRLKRSASVSSGPDRLALALHSPTVLSC